MRVEHLRKTDKIKERLIGKIEEYLSQGGSFHVERKSFPFIIDLKTYKRSLGTNESLDQIMKSLGYHNYSDIYYRYRDLERVSTYRDEHGYVDSFRSDLKLRNFVSNAGKTLGMPANMVVELICDERLSEYFVRNDYVDYVKVGLNNYLQGHHMTLDDIFVNDPVLYSKYRTLRTYLRNEYDQNFSDDDILYLLEIENVEHNFAGHSNEKISKKAKCKEIINKIFEGSNGERPSISKQSLTQADYLFIVKMAHREGQDVSTYFHNLGIDYVGGRKSERLSKYKTTEIPMLDQIKARRDEIINEDGITEANGYCHEEAFEERVKASLIAYQEYEKSLGEDLPVDDFAFEGNELKK